MTISNFCSYLLTVRTCIHILHFKSKIYSEHVALGDLYEQLLELLDNLIESSQTENLLDLKLVSESSKLDNALVYIENILIYIRNNRKVFPYSFQQNIVDEIENIFSKTIYKLRFLDSKFSPKFKL